jgi:acyl-CoA dehydrogenase
MADAVDVSDEVDEELVRRIVESGLFRYFVPEEHGGSGLSVTAVCLIREQLARVSAHADEHFASQGIAVQPIAMWGSDEQKETYLPGLLDGSRRFAFCLTEPAAGSDVGGIQGTAVRDGDSYIINASKRFIYQPHTCTTFLVFAKTDVSAGGRGISAFLFDKPDTGVTFRPYPLLFESPEYEVEFTDCRVPAASLLGPLGQGIKVALSNLDRLRPSVGATAVGMASRALEASIEYTRHRRAFGGHLADLQALRFKMATAATDIDAARLLVYAAAHNADVGGDDIQASAAKAKLFATEMATRVIDLAIQLHGGVGLVRGSLTERLYKASRALRIYEGSSEVMQLVIARSLLQDRR